MSIDLKRVKEIFLGAAELSDEAARAAYLDRACGGDAGLRERVEVLLRSHDPEGSFLGTPAAVVPDPDYAGTTAFDSSNPGGGPAKPDPDDESDDLKFLTPSSRPDSLGRLGHYEMLQVLGRGGFGIVFRAFDDMLQRVVAVKVMAPQIAALSPARRRFVREARSSAAVRHENVVQVYEVGEQPLPYLVMEFIPGETLQQKLDRSGPLDVPEVLRIGRQIAEGLAAAHACDLIHRDIKPGNILLEGGSHKAKITDFGLARAADDASISQSGIIAGTPMFMSPEQALGHKIDQRADLFSLGSVLYQMASGRPPFRAPSTLAVLKRVAEEAPRSIPEIIPETPEWLCGIIAKLHAKNPDDRFQSAREVADLLADCEAKLKAKQAVKNILPAAAAKPAGRKWAAAAAAVLLLPVIALAVTEVAGVTHLFRQQPNTDPIKPGGEPASVVLAKKETPVFGANQEPLPPAFTNSIGMEFVKVPKGKSWLGGGKDRPGDKEVEIPADFYLGKYEVTQEEWEKVMGETPSWFSRNGKGADAVKDISDGDLKRFPVEMVSWDQCQIFAEKLNQREKETGWVYRLPTETEWEYACRGGPLADQADSAFFYYFNRPTNELLPDMANIKDSGKDRTCAVGSYQPNRLGLYDMHGNLWEFCQDEKDHNGMSKRPARGGSWEFDSLIGRAAFRRNPHPPSLQHQTLGLRLARVPTGAPSPEAKTPPVAANVLKDAVLRMNFEKDTFYQKDGKTYVRDLSGNGNDGLCEDVEFTPAGKAGGGLACNKGRLRLNKSFINRQPNYTISLWARADKTAVDSAKALYRTASADRLEHLVFKIVHPPGQNIHVFAWNMNKQPESWMSANTEPSIPAGEWYFLAVTLSGGGAEKGELRVTINDTVTRLSSQMADNELDDLIDMLGHEATGCVLDEVAIFQRALTDQEIAAVRALGLKGTPLHVGKTPPATVGQFTDADVQRIAALPAVEQVEEVRKELMRRNPGFDGTVGHKIDGDKVTELRIVTDKVTDIAPIRVFNSLRVLDLSGTQVNFVGNGQLADLSPLTGMNLAGLERLNLNFTMVGDEGLVHFKDCKNLGFLNLDTTQVSDTGLAYFKDYTDLTYLNLNRLKISDAGLAHFKNCKNLKVLHLGVTPVSDAGLSYFKECEHLTVLGLARTRVTDAGLAHFKDCKKLANLSLVATPVTDAGLAHFKDCKELTRLHIGFTKVTDLSLLRGMPLKELDCTFRPERDAEILRSIKTLEKINGKPAAEFWERYDKGEFKE